MSPSREVMMWGASTRSSDDELHPASTPGHHHDRRMVTYLRGSLGQRATGSEKPAGLLRTKSGPR